MRATCLALIFKQCLQDAAVADAIYESTLPRSGSSAVATSPAGILVSLSDKLDSLVGLIAAGGEAAPLPVHARLEHGIWINRSQDKQ